MSINIKGVVGQYVSKIEVIGHRKSLVIELRLYATGEEQYKRLFNALSNLNLDNLAQMDLLAQEKLNALGVTPETMEEVSKKAGQK